MSLTQHLWALGAVAEACFFYYSHKKRARSLVSACLTVQQRYQCHLFFVRIKEVCFFLLFNGDLPTIVTNFWIAYFGVLIEI